MLRAVIIAAVALVAIACERQGSGGSGQARTFPTSATADSLLDAGEAVYRRSEYDSAATLLTSGREHAVSAGDSAGVARADTWLGLAAFRRGLNEEARRLGEAALAMKLRLGLENDFFRSYNALGLLAWNEGRLGDAADLFAKARTSAEAANDSIGVARAIANRGLVRADAGEFDLARSEFSMAIAAATRVGDTLLLANTMANLGMLEVRSGDAQAAITWLNRARPLYAAIDYPAGMDIVFGQLGGAFASLGDGRRAIAYLDSAMSVARSHGLIREEAEDLQLYAELIGEAGDHRSAIRHLERARMLADSAGLKSRAGDIGRAQARELAAISRIDLALARAVEAASIHRESKAAFEELKDHLLIAELAQIAKKPQQARDALSRANMLASELNAPVAAENLSLGTARVHDRAGDPTGVLRALPADLVFSRMGFSAAGEAHSLRARAFARLRQWPEAVSAGQKAVASLELVRQNLGEGSLRAAFVSDRANVYADLVVALLHLGRTSEAFEVADAARGRALLEHLNIVGRSARTATGNLVEADRLLREIESLTERLRVVDTLRSPDRSVSLARDTRALTRRLDTLRSEYNDRMRRAVVADPRGVAVLGIARPRTTEVQAALGSNEAMLEYFVTPDRLFVFLVTRDTIVSAESPVSLDELANRVPIAQQVMSHGRSANSGREVLRGLYDVLITPIEEHLTARRVSALVIVPHSVLAYLPFAPLVARDGGRLVERMSIVTLPSASALPVLRLERVTRSTARSTVFAPFPEELAGTREEAAAVAHGFRRAETFLGLRASESELRRALSQSDNVHVASHAVMNQANPMFSHIELAAGKQRSPDDDGRLDVHEMLRMPVTSRLVYLSGCETGVGASGSTAFRRSQDYATLSQAILYAGAQNVIATLWRIDDLGASVFAQKFYAALAANNPSDALALAQRSMMKDRRFAAPRYWAAYTISGSGIFKPAAQKVTRAAVQ